MNGFGIVDYSARVYSGHIIALRDQAYYVPGLTKDLCTIYLQASFTSGVYKGTFVEYCHNEHNIDA